MSEFEKWAAKKYPNSSRKDSLGAFSRDLMKSAREGWDAHAELAALKAGQGDAVAEFGSDCIFNLRKQPNGERWPAGTKLYTAPPASADAVSVPRELLERIVEHLEYDAIGSPSEVIAGDLAKELRALLAQSESKG